MKSFLLLAAMMIAFTGEASATAYHVSDCGSGATSACVAGNDSNPGTSPAAPWKTCAKVTARFPSLAAGDQILFARGSAQNACQLYFLSNLNSRAANPIVFGAYTPSWATGTTAVPILRGISSSYTLGLINSGVSTHDEGYVVQDLHFIGLGVSANMPAMMMSNDVDYVTIRRVEVEGFRIGIQCEGGTNSALAAGSDGLTQHIVIRDSNFHHNRGAGLYSTCSDLLVENNRFDNNGVGLLDHHLYVTNSGVGGVARTTTQVVIRGNTLTNNAPYVSATAVVPTPGACASVAIVAHGVMDGLIIENNSVVEPTVPASGSCWGISVDSGGYGHREGFSNVSIRGNTVVNYAVGVGLDLCDTCTIENNYVYSERPASAGVVAPSKYHQAAIPGNTLNNNLTIRNNTVYMKYPTYGSVGVRITRDGASHLVASNLIYFGTGSTADTACFNTSELSATAFQAFDYNLCYFAAVPGKWDSTRGTLAAQRTAGMDTHSQSGNPLLNAPVPPLYTLTMGANSPALRAGHPSSSAKLSFDGLRRDSTSDIGAFQQGATVVVPSNPTGMSIR